MIVFISLFLKTLHVILLVTGSMQMVVDFKAKENIPFGLVQYGASYYQHQDIPFLIIVTLLWYENMIVKRIFVVTSESNKQDVHFVIDSINYVLGLEIFKDIHTVFLVSDNASNMKDGMDLFNCFSSNGVLNGEKVERKRTIFRLFSWFYFLYNFLQLFFFSPHHGRSSADAFGGEYRKLINNKKLHENVRCFEDFKKLCEVTFQSEGTFPGSARVSILEFLFFFILIFMKIM
jgi:hypothetical protein